jgi:hypothetical protein
MSQKTTFAKWREELGLSIHEAGRLLGLSHPQICCLNRGSDAAGNTVVPKLGTRILMAAIADKLPLRPWELSEEELQALRMKTRRRMAGARRRFEEAA